MVMATSEGCRTGLVGSVPLANAEAVFRATTETLGARLRRVPDGETGDRLQWIWWQWGILASHPAFVGGTDSDGRPRAHLANGAPENLTFPDLGYATAAKKSYATFRRLQEAGVVRGDVRFQVNLPTPLAPVVRMVDADDQARVEPAYERAMLAELAAVTDALPSEALAVQWDVAVEIGVLEGAFSSGLSLTLESVATRLARLCDAVPPGVELGLHLCYGDQARPRDDVDGIAFERLGHFKEPDDLSLPVRIANALFAGVTRDIDWLHMPVPRDRRDDEYYSPLTDLRRPPATELYLGLVHLTDGIEGATRRARAARRQVRDFGIATECGLGRRPPNTIPELLRLHVDVAEAIDADSAQGGESERVSKPEQR